MKGRLILFSIVLSFSFWNCAGGGANNETENNKGRIEIGQYDKSIQSYIFPPTKVLSGQHLTESDLAPSSRLLLSPGGVLIGIAVGDGYQKVTSYQTEDVGGGWYGVTLQYTDEDGDSQEWVCAVKEKI